MAKARDGWRGLFHDITVKFLCSSPESRQQLDPHEAIPLAFQIIVFLFFFSAKSKPVAGRISSLAIMYPWVSLYSFISFFPFGAY